MKEKNLDGQDQYYAVGERSLFKLYAVSEDSFNGKFGYLPVELYSKYGNLLDVEDYDHDGKLDALFSYSGLYIVNDVLNEEKGKYKPTFLKETKKSYGQLWIDEDDIYFTTIGSLVHYYYEDQKLRKTIYKGNFFDWFTVVKNFGDIDSNGRKELISIRSREAFVLQTNRDKKPSKEDLFDLQGTWDEGLGMYFVPWTDDKVNDMVIITDTSAFLHTYQDDFKFNEPILLYDDPGTDNWFDVLCEDMDQDGRTDVILFSNDLIFVHNEADDKATATELGKGRFDPNGISISDIDGDGDKDIIAGTYYGLEIFYNDKGAFKNVTIDNGAYIDFWYQYDVDKDGDLDLLLSMGFAQYVHYMENDNGKLLDPQLLLFDH